MWKNVHQRGEKYGWQLLTKNKFVSCEALSLLLTIVVQLCKKEVRTLFKNILNCPLFFNPYGLYTHNLLFGDLENCVSLIYLNSFL